LGSLCFDKAISQVRSLGFILAALLVTPVTQADALCIYDGKLYAKTTLEQEFKDSTLVVRGTVLSSQQLRNPDENGDNGILYRVRINEAFKGKPTPIFLYYTEQNSGGFYLDRGKEYLLFLDPLSSTGWADDAKWAKAVKGSFVANYNCGQSREWAQVRAEDRSRLLHLKTPSP